MAVDDRGRFGGVIRDLRLARGLTQEELAQRAGIHPTYLGGIERGERNVGLENILKIARALGHRPGTLFERFK